MKPSFLPLDLASFGPPLWEVGWVRGVERDVLRALLGEPHLVETDSLRTCGGDEDWWVYKANGRVIAVCFRVPYEDAVVCVDSIAPDDISLAVSILEPWAVELFDEPCLR